MKFTIKTAICGILMLSAVLCACEQAPAKTSENLPAPTEMTVTVLNTGESDAILLSADGYTVLVDAADRDDAGTIADAVKASGGKRIDCLILTHYDKDHIGAVPSLLRSMKIGEIIGANYHSSSGEYEELSAYISSRNVKWTRLTQDETRNFGAMQITMLAPDKQKYSDENNYSIVLTVHYGDTSLLLLGDAMKDRLEEIEGAISGHYDLIKLPHHGEYNKTIERIVKAATPDYAVNCVGEAGHVEAKLRSLLARNKIESLCNCEGDIVLTTDGNNLTVTQKKQ